MTNGGRGEVSRKSSSGEVPNRRPGPEARGRDSRPCLSPLGNSLRAMGWVISRSSSIDSLLLALSISDGASSVTSMLGLLSSATSGGSENMGWRALAREARCCCHSSRTTTPKDMPRIQKNRKAILAPQPKSHCAKKEAHQSTGQPACYFVPGFGWARTHVSQLSPDGGCLGVAAQVGLMSSMDARIRPAGRFFNNKLPEEGPKV